MRKFAIMLVLALVAAGSIAHAATSQPSDSTPDRSSCVIKGNISSSGERIYHEPGQRYYDATIIQPEKGERWFCSEAEARAAGWRRAKV